MNPQIGGDSGTHVGVLMKSLVSSIEKRRCIYREAVLR